MTITGLAALVAELHAITRRTGPLTAEEMSDIQALVALPVYVDDPHAPKLLFDDLADAIASDLNREDRIIAEHLFRLRGDPDLDIGARQNAAVKEIPLGHARQIRYPREDWVLGQIAHALYARANAPDRAGWHHGDGYIFTDFTIDTFPNPDLTARTTRYSFTIRAVRNRVEFYKFGTIFPGSRKAGKPRLLSQGQTQQYVASVPVDKRRESTGAWHIVRFNPKLTFGAEPTVVLEEDTELLNTEDRIREAGLTVAGLDPVAAQLGIASTALLRVHIPRSVVPEYSRKMFSLTSDVMDRPLWEDPVLRSDDTPMEYRPDPALPEHRYAIDWSADLLDESV